MKKIVKCKVCGKDIAKGAICPVCGKNNKNFFMRHKVLTVVLAFFILFGFAGAGGMSSDSETTEVNSDTDVVQNTDKEESKSVDKKEEVEEKKSPEVEKNQQSKNDVPKEYKSALKKAKIYSDTMFMSKDGIYNQLVSEYGEKFSAEAAQYAIDNLTTDYNRNALSKAKTYQETMAMSRDRIYEQLTSEYGEKFTAEEAQYAIDNLE